MARARSARVDTEDLRHVTGASHRCCARGQTELPPDLDQLQSMPATGRLKRESPDRLGSGLPPGHSPSVHSSYQRGSGAASLNPKKARPPATTRPIQLNHIGTDQSPMSTGQPI